MFQLQTTALSDLRREAVARIKAGYDFPDLPEDTGEQWTVEFDTFAKGCSSALKKRCSDYKLLSANEEYEISYLMASDAMILFGAAIVAKDIELIRIYHRLIQQVERPRELHTAVKLLRSTLPLKPVHDVISVEHISVTRRIERELWDFDEIAVEGLTSLAFEDLSQVDRILMFTQRGVCDAREMRKRLAEVSDVESPLLEGTL